MISLNQRITSLENNSALETLQTELNNKQNTITEGSLSIANTSGLQAALNEKQPSITTSTNIQCNTLTTEGNINVNGIISYPNIPAFKAHYNTINATEITVNAGSLFPNNAVVYDTTNSYDKDNFQYIIPAAGKYFFSASWFSSDSLFIVDFRKNEVRMKRSEVKEAQLKFTTFNFNVTLDCLVGDRVDVRVNTGRIITQYNIGPAPDGWHHFEGFKIS